MARSNGFTLLELLLVIAILAVLGGAGAAYYRNTAKDIEITSAARTIMSDIKTAREKALAGQDQRRWGVHFVNGTQDYWEVFSTATDYSDPGVVVDSSGYLQNSIVFTDPASASTKDVLFSNIGGTTTPATVTIASQTQSVTVTVTSLGAVY